MTGFALRSVLQMIAVIEIDEVLQGEDTGPGDRLFFLDERVQLAARGGRIYGVCVALQAFRRIGNADWFAEFFGRVVAFGAGLLLRRGWCG